MVARYAGTSDFERTREDFVGKIFKRELAGRVKAVSAARGLDRSHSICANHSTGRVLKDNEMVASLIEFVFVTSVDVGRIKTFVQLEIKDLESQTQGLVYLVFG